MQIVLNSFGCALTRDNEGFVVVTSDGSQRVPVKGVESIHVSKGAQISSDAVMLAVENEIEILFADRMGNVVGRVWSPKYGSVSTIRKGQLNFVFGKEAVKWIKETLQRKIENQQAMLLLLNAANGDDRKTVEKTVSKLEDYRSKIDGIEGEVVADVAATLRGWEGVASKRYFETMNLFLPEPFRFEQRTQHPATDVANAFLNYGYGMLYAKVESALIKAGIDPYIGVLHRDDYNRPVLVYDVIELYRVWVDYVVWNILNQGVVTDEFYSKREDGSVWLEGLGRRVIIQSLNDYLSDVVEVQGVSRSREHQIFLYVQNLAQQFKKLNPL